jgi:hypothetical protein|tara:strand:+ start:1381 stop:2085 length:705 start_codon:yes stop_codon:yes gene_type:complete
MKLRTLTILTATALAALTTMTGCSNNPLSQGNGAQPGTNATTAISEQRAENDFSRYGVKIYYGLLSGEVDQIDTVGYAPVWGNSQSAIREAYRVAELEAKKSLNDFINRENVASTTSVRMIAHNLEQAHDNKKNNFASNVVKATDTMQEVENANSATPGQGSKSSEDNTAIRNDALKIASIVNTTITVKNSGIIAGLYLVKGEVINNGKNVQVLYRWDKKSNKNRPLIRAQMMM